MMIFIIEILAHHHPLPDKSHWYCLQSFSFPTMPPVWPALSHLGSVFPSRKRQIIPSHPIPRMNTS